MKLENIHNSQRVKDEKAQEKNGNIAGNKIHGNTILNSLRRQEVLEFAIYVKNKWPAQCKNAVQWAKVIEEKSPLKWHSGEPPLSTRMIEDMLRGVIKDPIQLKST